MRGWVRLTISLGLVALLPVSVAACDLRSRPAPPTPGTVRLATGVPSPTAAGSPSPLVEAPVTTRLADGAIVFSSEKKALLELLGGSAAAGGVDGASLQHYLTLQYVPEPATMILLGSGLLAAFRARARG